MIYSFSALRGGCCAIGRPRKGLSVLRDVSASVRSPLPGVRRGIVRGRELCHVLAAESHDSRLKHLAHRELPVIRRKKSRRGYAWLCVRARRKRIELSPKQTRSLDRPVIREDQLVRS